MLDPSTVQLLFADLQDSVMDYSATNSPATIRTAARTLTGIAAVLGLPVTLSMAPRPGGPGVIAELADRRPASQVQLRTGPSCFDHPATVAALRAANRPVLAICGVTTEMVVLCTAMDALARGMRVYVIIDACGGLTTRTEDAALRQIEAAGGTTTSTASLIAQLIRDFTGDLGPAALAAIRTLTQPTPVSS